MPGAQRGRGRAGRGRRHRAGGTGSATENVQRLGRILRKHGDKQAVLYEVIARGTAEEYVSRPPAPAPGVSNKETRPMLTGKLVRVRLRARTSSIPQYVDPRQRPCWRRRWRIRLLLAYRGAPGRTRGEIEDDLADLIPEGPRGLVRRGSPSCWKTAASSRSTADHPPDELREAVFRSPPLHRAEAAKIGTPFDRTAVLPRSRSRCADARRRSRSTAACSPT